MRPLVILRPQPGATATATAAQEMGLSPVVMPLFEIEPVEWRAPDADEYDGLLLTSANALHHGGAELERVRSLPVHCVGKATALVARDLGFSIATTGSGGVDALLETLPPKLRLLHLCGIDRREPQEPRQTLRPIAVYRSTELPQPAKLKDVEGAVAALHSPRAAARFAQLADEAEIRRDTIAVAAISDEAAGAAGAGWEKVEAAGEPSDAALLALASRLCNNSR